MLCRCTRRGLSSHWQRQSRLFSTPAYEAWSKRQKDMQTKYPSLFGDAFVKDQEKLLKKVYTKGSLSSLVSDYEKGRQSTAEKTGEDVFMTLDVDALLADVPTPVRTTVQSDAQIKPKLEYATKLVKDLLPKQQMGGLSLEEQNLRMIEVADFGEKLADWQLRIPDDVNDTSDLGLPISDEELDDWVNYQYYIAPDNVRDAQMEGLSYEDHKKVEEAWMGTLDNKLAQMLKKRDPKFDSKRFASFCEVTNEIFHPFSIDHYNLSDYAKSVFRAALWQSKDRLETVEKSIVRLEELLNDVRDNDAQILRRTYELFPDTPLPGLAALQLQITDPLFAARLCDEARAALELVAVDRAQKDVFADLTKPHIARERKEWEAEAKESMTESLVLRAQREVSKLDAEEATFSVEVPTLESVLDELLPKRLWARDIGAVKSAILEYASGKGSLAAVNDAVHKTMAPKSESAELTDENILHMSVRYHNAIMENRDWWNLASLLDESLTKREDDEILNYRRLLKSRLEREGLDPLVVNLVRILVEDNQAAILEKTLGDYQVIMKRFRGEIDGVITSAEELDNATFDTIRKAIEKANPGKKITLEQQVDVGLGAGFVVKAGVQRFDYSLAAHIDDGRKVVDALAAASS